MASTYLSRTPSGTGNKQKFTFSAWIKKQYQATGTNRRIVSSYFNNGGRHAFLTFGSDEQLYAFSGNYTSGASTTDSYRLNSSRKFRDVNAWYHIVYRVDTTQSTASDRIRCYVNGELLAWDTSHPDHLYPSQNDENYINSDYPIQINALNGNDIMDCCMTHIHFIDGTAYDASAFGETDATTGIWKPKTAPSVTYGTNGFFLKFENSASFGTDSSGNANNFTVNGTMTQTIDTPSNVFATLNPLDSGGGGSYSNGNLTYQSNTPDLKASASSFAINNGNASKWYWEVKMVSKTGSVWQVGTISSTSYYIAQPYSQYSSSGQVYVNGSQVDTVATYTTNDIISVAFDATTSEVKYYKNGSLVTTQTISNPNNILMFAGSHSDSSAGYSIYSFNFGNGYFGTTAVSSAENPDDGIGIFEYEVPAGYKALCTKSINAQEYS